MALQLKNGLENKLKLKTKGRQHMSLREEANDKT